MIRSNPSLFLKSLAVAILTALSATLAGAQTLKSIKLGWNAVPETGILGYKVYVGTASNQYTQNYDAGTSLTLTVPDRVLGSTYYFAVKSIGAGGLESAFSGEIAVTIATPPLPTGGGMAVSGSGQRSLSWSFPKAALTSSPEFIVEQSVDLVNWTVAATVLPSASTGGTTQTANFAWPVAVSGLRRFYRLTARNWLGTSTGS
jgi:hypothetical protein